MSSRKSARTCGRQDGPRLVYLRPNGQWGSMPVVWDGGSKEWITSRKLPVGASMEMLINIPATPLAPEATWFLEHPFELPSQ